MRYAELGVPHRFVQDNLSSSTRGVLRGLHYQHPNAQGKLVSVARGEVFDVAADIRPDSPSFGQWVGVHLSSDNHRSLYIPPGYAHGFVVLSDEAIFSYKCTEYYAPHCEASLIWNDPDLAIEWPTASPRLSPKDLAAPRLATCPATACQPSPTPGCGSSQATTPRPCGRRTPGEQAHPGWIDRFDISP